AAKNSPPSSSPRSKPFWTNLKSSDPSAEHTAHKRKNFRETVYPTQFIVDRAMGNYLGLCQLGLFIASELGITFSEFTCFIATPKLGDFNKTPLRDLEKSAQQFIEIIENQKPTATS
ncbi:MAG: hypothetical protein AB7Q64_23695, partial [Verrucomicrobiales bacterium]